MSSNYFSSFVTRISFCLFSIFLIAGIANLLQAQSFDHEPYPKLDFNFNSLVLDLGIQPQNLRIDGAAKYNVTANVSGADTLILYASHIDVSSVSVDGEAVDYSLNNDSLYVPVVDSSEAGQEYDINIRYSGRPQFGLLKNAHGTVWTSQLPKAQRHWVPIVDNPQVAFKTTFNISLPSGLQLWATGEKTAEDTVSVEVMKYQFKSEKEVPASSLALAIGKFDSQSTSYGIKKINLAIERLLSETTDGQKLLRKAYDYLGAVEDHLNFEYPFDRLNIVLLEDHSWETKSWGASTVFLYANRGNLETQLLRGILGQWFGVYQRESRWEQADAITLYQTLIAQELRKESTKLTSADDLESPSTVYGNFGVDRWNQWQASIAKWQNPSIHTQVSGFASDILNNFSGVISWDDYADFWYRELGQPLFTLPEFSSAEDTVAAQQDSVAYNVVYSLNEAEGKLKLRFESTYGSYSELTTLEAHEIYPNKTDTAEVTFTGTQDSVVLQVEPTIQDFRLMTSDYPKLVLDEYKPAPFLIYELQSAETVGQRAEAARKLGHHKENPDLQLAITDFMNREEDPKVKAALLSSLADITNGASGTEQTFLDALQSDHEAIRNAGLMAMQNYKESPSILNRVQSVAQNADGFEMFKKATQVLTVIASQEQFAGFVESVAQQDTLGQRSIFAIQELANLGAVDEAVKRANLFTGDQYSYGVRSRALQILIQHDHAPADWLSRAEELLSDADPRIRFWTVEGLEQNKNAEILDFLNERIQDEYDARVYQVIEQAISD